jgi:hypothetical protein
MAATVAYRKQSGKPVGLAGGGDTVPPPRGGSQSPATRSPYDRVTGRSRLAFTVSIRQEREAGRVCCVSEIYTALSANALLVGTQPLFDLHGCYS